MKHFIATATAIVIAVCSLALISSLEATHIADIDSSTLLRCTFSSKHQNRIAIDGERIKKVIYSESDLVVCTDETSGQLFVRTHANGPSVTTLSVITPQGVVQDVEITFVDRPSEILILKEPFTEEEEFTPEIDIPDCDDEVNAMQHAIEMLLTGSIPEEYIPVEDRQVCYLIKRSITMKSVMRLVGPIYTIYVFHIENQGRGSTRIQESAINCIGGEWVFLEKHDIERKSKVLALIGLRTDEVGMWGITREQQ